MKVGWFGRMPTITGGGRVSYPFHKVRVCIVDELKFLGYFSLGEACLFCFGFCLSGW
jgi:hypothetical protein